MNFIYTLVDKINPLWPLRLGLGLMYIYSGYDLFYHPKSWLWAVPSWFAEIISSIISIENFIRFQGIIEFLVALLLLAPSLKFRLSHSIPPSISIKNGIKTISDNYSAARATQNLSKFSAGLAWFSGIWGVRAAAIFSTLEMAAILLFTGIDPITFRDIGLLGASSTLLILSFREGGNGGNQQI